MTPNLISQKKGTFKFNVFPSQFFPSKTIVLFILVSNILDAI